MVLLRRKISPLSFSVLLPVITAFILQTTYSLPVALDNSSKIKGTIGLEEQAKNETTKFLDSDENEIQSYMFSEYGPILVGGPDEEDIEYEVGKVLRCAAIGDPKPVVAWEYYGKPLPDDFLHESEDILDLEPYEKEYWELIDIFRNNTNISFSETLSEISTPGDTFNCKEDGFVTWVDLKLPKLNMAIYGELECVAENDEGVISKFYYVVHNANSSVFMKMVRTSVAAVLLTLAVLAYKYCQWKGEQKRILRYKSLLPRDLKIIQKFQNGLGGESDEDSHPTHSTCYTRKRTAKTTAETTLTEASGSSNKKAGKDIAINSWIDNTPYNEQKQILKENFKIYEQEVLQTGEFGVLLKGKIRCPKTMKYDTVAVLKALQDNVSGISSRNFEAVLKEVKTLASLPNDHLCLVNMEAAHTKELYKKKVFLFLEYCEIGALDDFLEKNANQFQDLWRRKQKSTKQQSLPPKKRRSSCGCDSHSHNDKSEDKVQKEGITFSTEDLVVWSAEIAEGMKYLHKHKIMHGNLSTSCVYLTEELVAKVGKIGLPPKISKNNLAIFPPESKLLLEYSYKWDVWSYGVTLWDIFSLQKQKLPTFKDLGDFQSLQTRVHFPRHSCQEINTIIENCWKPEPNCRPDFVTLSEDMKRIVQTL